MIRVSKLADYAVVIMATLVTDDESLVSAARLSDLSNVPEPTVSKVLKMLSKGGLIKSTRGINGGYELIRNPKEITLEDIITVIDGPVSITQCASGKNPRCGIDVCSMRGRWSGVNDAITDALTSVSLYDIIHKDDLKYVDKTVRHEQGDDSEFAIITVSDKSVYESGQND
ncbi:MAG: SUF system Fe-S cluster assembly regulator [Alphaproteobacteria bacterium]